MKLLIALLFLGFSEARADSPLTSTTFSTAYEQEDIIVVAKAAKSRITGPLLNYLVDASNPIEMKMAVINQLGWNFKGQKNAFFP